MKESIKNIIKAILFIVIPCLSVLISIILNRSEGDMAQAIGLGLLLGLVLDLVYCFILARISIRRDKDTY